MNSTDIKWEVLSYTKGHAETMAKHMTVSFHSEAIRGILIWESGLPILSASDAITYLSILYKRSQRTRSQDAHTDMEPLDTDMGVVHRRLMVCRGEPKRLVLMIALDQDTGGVAVGQVLLPRTDYSAEVLHLLSLVALQRVAGAADEAAV